MAQWRPLRMRTRLVYYDYCMVNDFQRDVCACRHDSADDTATFSNKQLYVKSIYTFYESIQIFVR